MSHHDDPQPPIPPMFVLTFDFFHIPEVVQISLDRSLRDFQPRSEKRNGQPLRPALLLDGDHFITIGVLPNNVPESLEAAISIATRAMRWIGSRLVIIGPRWDREAPPSRAVWVAM
jgi:hypothetical protein